MTDSYIPNIVRKKKGKLFKPRWMLISNDGRPIIGNQEMYYFTLIAALIDSLMFLGTFHKIQRIRRKDYTPPQTQRIDSDKIEQ